jgi:hypothetical protein
VAWKISIDQEGLEELLAVYGKPLPCSLSLGTGTLVVVFAKVVTIEIALSADTISNNLILDITKATALGFGWFGTVRVIAAQKMLAMADMFGGKIRMWKDNQGNLRLYALVLKFDSVGISNGVLGLEIS